jgi:hypothetical protein
MGHNPEPDAEGLNGRLIERQAWPLTSRFFLYGCLEID